MIRALLSYFGGDGLVNRMANEENGDDMKKRYLIFAGQEFYANGGANDLISSTAQNKTEAIHYANGLIGKYFAILDEDGDEYAESAIEWVHVFDLVECDIIHRVGNVFGNENGIKLV